jgi:protein-S-isoprenylcysteine O-methyltransferase Ste14
MQTGSVSHAWLAARSLLWAILLPGIVAGYVPWRYFGVSRVREAFGPLQSIGLLCMAMGIALLVACIVEFARRGKGTLSPVDPPRYLVVRGLYRFVRNPMYLSVTTILLGEALWVRSAPLTAYWAMWFVCVHLFVIAYEEPNLRERFGSSYDHYARHVRRWIPGVRGYRISVVETEPPPKFATQTLRPSNATENGPFPEL